MFSQIPIVETGIMSRTMLAVEGVLGGEAVDMDPH